MVFNLISLWIKASDDLRLIVLTISLVAHVVYVNFVMLLVPATYDYTPRVGKLRANYSVIERISKHSMLFSVVCFRGSLAITALLILSTLVVRKLQSLKIETPSYMRESISFLTESKIGEVLFCGHSVCKLFFWKCSLIKNTFLFLRIRVVMILSSKPEISRILNRLGRVSCGDVVALCWIAWYFSVCSLFIS